MYGVIGTIQAAPGHGDELEGHLLRAAALLDAEATCHLYLVSRLDDRPDEVHVTEVWVDADAHQASLQLPAVQQLIADARPIIAGMGERTELRVVGGSGLASGSAGG